MRIKTAWSARILPVLFAASLGLVTACEEEGTMEQVGEKADEAVEETGEAVEETGEQIGEAAEEAAQEAEKATK